MAQWMKAHSQGFNSLQQTKHAENCGVTMLLIATDDPLLSKKHHGYKKFVKILHAKRKVTK